MRLQDFKIPAEKRPLATDEVVIIAGVAFLFFGLLGAEVITRFSFAKASILILPLCWVVQLVIHELGHAIATRMIGWEIHEIVIGIGKEVRRCKPLGYNVRLKSTPLAGHVLPLVTSPEGARWKSAFTYAAGPGIEILLALVIFLAIGPQRILSAPTNALVLASQCLIVTALLGAMLNLVPLRTKDGNMTDGLGILRSALLSEAQIRGLIEGSEWKRVEAILEEGTLEDALGQLRVARSRHPNSAYLHLKEAWLLSLSGRHEEADAWLREIQDLTEDNPGIKAEYYHTKALVALNDPEARPTWEADAAIRKALEIFPDEAEYHITHSAILLQKGETQAAVASLIHLYQSSYSQETDARCLAYLVQVARATGDPQLEHRLLEAFHLTKPQVHLRRMLGLA